MNASTTPVRTGALALLTLLCVMSLAACEKRDNPPTPRSDPASPSVTAPMPPASAASQ